MDNIPHSSVLKDEVIHYLSPRDGEIYLDGTFGAGGHSKAILDSAPKCKLIAIDRDPLAAKFVNNMPSDFQLICGCYGDMRQLLQGLDIEKLDGILLDIGVSSMQLDQADRGFSFQSDGPLDMRMGESGISATDIINTYSESEIADILYLYGDERKSRRIAKSIVTERQNATIENTRKLADIIRNSSRPYNDKIDPATRSFQAIRIAVNDELGELERGLDASLELLNPGGRLLVITFHSGEDRIVKHFMKKHAYPTSPANNISRHSPEAILPISDGETGYLTTPKLKIIEKRGIRPSAEEITENPRARSAVLRVAIKQ